jgi:integrase/recombinase XerD
MFQGQLFEDEYALPVEDYFRAPMPAREEWIFKPAFAFEKWVTYVASPDGDRQYSQVSVRQFKAMFGAFWHYLLGTSAKHNVLTIGQDGIAEFLDGLEGRESAGPGRDREQPDPARPELVGIVGVAKPIRAKVTTKVRYVRLLDDLMQDLVLANYRVNNPMRQAARVVKGKANETEVVFMNEGDDKLLQQYLLEAYDLSSWERRRQQAMLLFVLGSGVNVAQATSAMLDDFVFNDVFPSFDVVKEREQDGERVAVHRVPISKFCVPVVRAWIEERRAFLDSDLCEHSRGCLLAFPRDEQGEELSAAVVWMHTQECLEHIGFKGKEMGPRVLRNTFIRRQLLAGIPDEAIMQMCGLKTDKTLQRIRARTPARHTQAA